MSIMTGKNKNMNYFRILYNGASGCEYWLGGRDKNILKSWMVALQLEGAELLIICKIRLHIIEPYEIQTSVEKMEKIYELII